MECLEFCAAQILVVVLIYIVLDWPLSWREVFALLSDAFASCGNAVLLHCKNGKDRSCFLIYAFWRLRHGMEHAEALTCVSQRIDMKGCPLYPFPPAEHGIHRFRESYNWCVSGR